MFKKAHVVMLPTNEKAPIFKVGDWDKIYKTDQIPSLAPAHFSKDESYQHLYIVSDEEIKEGDKFIYDDGISNVQYILSAHTINRVGWITSFENYSTTFGISDWNPKYCKKIIATTNNKLLLPQPSQSFIDKYITEYNKGNIITDVMVEYETKWSTTINLDGGDSTYEWILKINPKDNTITIKRIKDSWTRNELKEIALRFHFDFTLSKDNIPGTNVGSWFDKWFID